MQKICEGLQMDGTEHLPVHLQKICVSDQGCQNVFK